MVQSRQVFLEPLEDRTVPTQFGVPWPAPQQLTLSFVPDHTLVDNQPSSLFQMLRSAYPSPADWQLQVEEAFQTWAQWANINIGVVADDGEPLGTSGAIQGDPRFGDIRIAAQP